MITAALGSYNLVQQDCYNTIAKEKETEEMISTRALHILNLLSI